MYHPATSVERARTRSWLLRETLERLDAELVVLAQGTAALRLGVGEALDELGAHGGPLALGFSSLEAYARERCEQSGRWARDARALGRRLRERPAMRAALLAGELGWSMAELISRHGEPADERELLALARGKTVRQMRKLLRERAAQGDGQGDEAADGDGSGPSFLHGDGRSASSRDDDECEPEPPVTLTVTLTAEEAWFFECTKMLIQALGARSDGDVIDRLLAESMTTLLGAVPGAADELELSLDCAPFGNPEHVELHRQWQEQLASWRDEAEALCEPRIPQRVPAPSELSELIVLREELPAEAVGLDRLIVDCSTQLLRRDLELGEQLQRLCDGNGWRRLGYASLGQYARERLGLSLSSVKARMTLARRAGKLAPLRAAVEQAELGFEAAMLVGRVATERTVQAWVERAKRRTIKHLGEEVTAVEILARTTGQGDLPPPDGETMAAMMALESQVLSGRIFRGEGEPRRGPMSVAGSAVDQTSVAGGSRGEVVGAGAGPMSVAGSVVGQTSVAGGSRGEVVGAGAGPMSVGGASRSEVVGAGAGQMSVAGRPNPSTSSRRPAPEAGEEEPATPPRRGAGKVTLRWRVPQDVARAWHALAQLYRRSSFAGSFVELLCLTLWRTWEPTLGSDVAYADLYARERYRCSSPVCFSRNQTPHHIQFRSQGGDDRPENLTAPCASCHLEGIHGGAIRASGSSPDLLWQLGRQPILEVHGRERRRLPR